MARLAAKEKMGFYPTPPHTLKVIVRKFLRGSSFDDDSMHHFLDPCCGEGEALQEACGWLYPAKSWGIELDVERAASASDVLDEVVQGSIHNVGIGPEGSMGLLWLNPPYDDSDESEREEMRFLKHSVKWLCPGGILVFIVPERIFEQEKNRRWISGWFKECSLYRIVEEEYGRFKQAVLFGRKRAVRSDVPPDLPRPPYPYMPEFYKPAPVPTYEIPCTTGPSVFTGRTVVSDEDIVSAGAETRAMIRKLLLKDRLQGALSPLFPLRKGHLISLITAGFLNGRVTTGTGVMDFILIKGYSERVSSVRTEGDREITTETYRVGVRVIDPRAGRWYDIT